MANAIEKCARRRRWSHWTSNLTTLTHESTCISKVVDILFIKVASVVNIKFLFYGLILLWFDNTN